QCNEKPFGFHQSPGTAQPQWTAGWRMPTRCRGGQDMRHHRVDLCCRPGPAPAQGKYPAGGFAVGDHAVRSIQKLTPCPDGARLPCLTALEMNQGQPRCAGQINRFPAADAVPTDDGSFIAAYSLRRRATRPQATGEFRNTQPVPLSELSAGYGPHRRIDGRLKAGMYIVPDDNCISGPERLSV